MKSYPAIAAMTHKSPGAVQVYKAHQVNRVIANHRREQANMRAHLQQWCHIFFDLENSIINKDEAVAEMKKLYFTNPYEDIE